MHGPKYPKSMYKLGDGAILSEIVHNEAQEHGHAQRGWSPKVPVLPPPVEHNATGVPLHDDTAAAIGGLAEALAELAARVEKLEQKRGPGRPPKE